MKRSLLIVVETWDETGLNLLYMWIEFQCESLNINQLNEYVYVCVLGGKREN